MADTQPTPAEPVAPDFTSPDPGPTPTPDARKPVVYATDLLEELVLPGAGDKGTDLRITSAGTALTKTQARHVDAAAHAVGVTLHDLTDHADPAEKD